MTEDVLRWTWFSENREAPRGPFHRDPDSAPRTHGLRHVPGHARSCLPSVGESNQALESLKLHFGTAHNRTVPSSPAESRVRPSGEKATLRTQSACPS
jgi:hypothetical protein